MDSQVILIIKNEDFLFTEEGIGARLIKDGYLIKCGMACLL